MWADEGLTLITAQWPSRLLIAAPVDATPGLYYLLHKWFVPEDAGVMAIRSISIICGTLCIPAGYALGRAAVSERSGLITAALIALSAPLVDYSQEARAYSLLVLLVIVSAAALIWMCNRLRERRSPDLATLIFAASTTLSFYTHVVSIFWIAPAVALAGWRAISHRNRTIGLALTAMAIAAWPQIARLLTRQPVAATFDWLSQSTAPEFVGIVSRNYLPVLGDSSAAVVGMIMAFAAIIIIRRKSVRDWSRKRSAAAFAIAALALVPVALWLFGFLSTPILMPRTALIGIPGFFVLLSVLIDRRRSWEASVVILLYAVALMIAGPIKQREDWRTVAASIGEAGEPIIICPHWRYPAFRHAVGSRAKAIFVAYSGQIIRVEPSQNWAQTYFKRIERPERQLQSQANAMSTPVRPLVGSRAWLVQSDCPREDLSSVKRWLGRGQFSHIATTRPSRDGGPIHVLRFAPDRRSPN